MSRLAHILLQNHPLILLLEKALLLGPISMVWLILQHDSGKN
jgi:hypothetical protein